MAACRMARLLAQDVLYCAVVRYPFVGVVLSWRLDGWLLFLVHAIPGGRGYLKYLDLYLQGSMSGVRCPVSDVQRGRVR